MNSEISVTDRLPDNGRRVLCFGHMTYCCELDMVQNPEWHEVTFNFDISSYRLKKTVPDDPEESILQEYKMKENWKCGSESIDGHVLKVTKWKNI